MARTSVERSLVLSLCDINQQGNIPPACAAAQMIVSGMRLYCLGGADERQSYDTLYCLEIEKLTWSTVDTTGYSKPSPRYGHTLNLFRNTCILFGGLERSDEEDCDLRTNKLKLDVSPPPICDANHPSISRTANCQPRLWAHRGVPTNVSYSLKMNEMLWTLVPTLSSNHSLHEESSPPPLCFHSATVCSMNDEFAENNFLLIWGGSKDQDFKLLSNELYALDLISLKWSSPLQQTGFLPSPRYGHQMVYVKSLKGVLLFGGITSSSGGSPASDSTFFFLDLSNVSIDRAGKAPAIDTDNGDTVVWSVFEAFGTPPFPRAFHSMAIVNDRLFIFAGLGPLYDCCGLYTFDIKRRQWCRPLFEGDIGLAAPGAAVLHDKLLVFGGARLPCAEHALTDAESATLLSFSKSSRVVPPSIRLSRHLCFLSVLEIKRSMTSNEHKFKVVTVGDSGVGKSCLLERFSQDIYNDAHQSTVGVDFRSLATISRGRLVTLQLWDTAGQEQFGGLTGNYYRNADGFIIVFDATRQTSFEHVVDWMSHIKKYHEFGPDTVKLLIGNKQDLANDLQVSQSDAKRLADSMGAIYLATSARTGAGVDKAFLLAARQLVELRKEGKKLNKQALTEGITLSENNAASGAGLSDNFFGDAVDNVCPNCVLGGSLSRRL